MPEKSIDQKSKSLFYDTIKSIEKNEIIDFLTSLLSSAEIKDISRRTMVAKFLKRETTYREISEIMGMSESTVNKIYFKTKGSPIINKVFKNT